MDSSHLNVFVSYPTVDAPLAQKLSKALEDRGLSTSIHTRDLQPGQDFVHAIDNALRRADAVVFVVEPDQQADRRVQYEWRTALKHSWSNPTKAMIPVLRPGAEPPPFLRDRMALQIEDRPGQWDAFVDRLVLLIQSPGGGVKDMSAYEDDRLRQQKGLKELEQWANALKAGGDDSQHE